MPIADLHLGLVHTKIRAMVVQKLHCPEQHGRLRAHPQPTPAFSVGGLTVAQQLCWHQRWGDVQLLPCNPPNWCERPSFARLLCRARSRSRAVTCLSVHQAWRFLISFLQSSSMISTRAGLKQLPILLSRSPVSQALNGAPLVHY